MVKRTTPRLRTLFARIKRLTKARGSKAPLAAHLGVNVSLLYDWFAERFEPGGEVTLQMLEWAEAEEGKNKKDAEAGATAPALKAQAKKSTSNEKPSSGQRGT